MKTILSLTAFILIGWLYACEKPGKEPSTKELVIAVDSLTVDYTLLVNTFLIPLDVSLQLSVAPSSATWLHGFRVTALVKNF